MMNKSNPFRHLTVAVFACLLAASCSGMTDDGTTLPDGKYPMTFTSSVDGLTATRATTDNSWTGGEEVAIEVDGEVKKYTAASNGNLTVASGGTPFYWQSAAEIKTVSAWYYGTGYNATPPGGISWAVQPDQSKAESGSADDNYQRSDFLYAPPTDISFSGRNSTALAFHHQTSRVVVNIVKADAATDASAIQRVVIGNAANLALSGSYAAPTDGAAAGTWDTSSGNPMMGTVTPKKLDTPLHTLPGGGIALASYTALVIPQDMTDQKIIAVTLTNGNTYYYIPKTNAANLQSDKQYTYDITVKHGYLEVTSATVSSEWGSGENAEDVTGKYLLDDYAPGKLKIGDYYYSDGNTSDGSYRKYSDGSTAIMPVQPVLTGEDGKERTVIGIVFWLGDATAADKTLATDHSGCTHGLVVALKDASESTPWQDSFYSFVQGWLNENRSGDFLAVHSEATSTSVPLNNIQGYNNTKAIEAFNAANLEDKVQAVETVVAYRDQVKAPVNSSDWYLPSEKELTLLCGKEVADIWDNKSGGTANRDLINKKIGSISGAATISSAYYWSSTAYFDYGAFYVGFGSGSADCYPKSYTCRVRCTLAF